MARRKLEPLIGLFWDIGSTSATASARRGMRGECADRTSRRTNAAGSPPALRQSPPFAEFDRHVAAASIPRAALQATEQAAALHAFNDTPHARTEQQGKPRRGARPVVIPGGVAAPTSALVGPRAPGLVVADEFPPTGGVLPNCSAPLAHPLHHLAGRREDRLSFEHQEPLAASFGLQDGGQTSRGTADAALYRNAKLVTQLNTLVHPGTSAAGSHPARCRGHHHDDRTRWCATCSTFRRRSSSACPAPSCAPFCSCSRRPELAA